MNNFQIGNFKAFSDPQTVPLKPITIIFGPNSSGKSSVIHSLLLARHGIDTQSLEAVHPSIAGDSVDLGGFRQYIHRRNVENRLQWSAELNVSSLPANLSSDLAKANKLSVHLTAGLQLGYSDQAAPSAMPFTQVCEYRIDGDPFLQLTRGAPKSDFKVSRLNREHAVFEPILQAMLLSSSSRAALNEEDTELLHDLIDSIVPKLVFPGGSDFLPGPTMDQEAVDAISRPGLYESDANQFSKLGGIEGAVRTFLPPMLNRFHSGVHQSLLRSLGSLSYLGPLRSVPPRHMAFADADAFGHPAGGAQAWQELAVNAEVREKVNTWLGDETKLKTPYRLELESFFSQQTVGDIVSNLQEGIANWSVQDFLRGLPSDSDFLERYLEHKEVVDASEDLADWGELDTELGELISEHADLEEAFTQWVSPTLTDLLNEKQEPGSADIRLYDVRKRTPVSHRDVGIGVSQVLPVLVQAYASKGSLLAMEQPEIHLHPALQAELGDVFIESALGEQRNRFVLETHSEHLILRILRRIREASRQDSPSITPDDVCVLYVHPRDSGAQVMEMRISPDGQFLDPWPGGFFPERIREITGGQG